MVKKKGLKFDWAEIARLTVNYQLASKHTHILNFIGGGNSTGKPTGISAFRLRLLTISTASTRK